MPKRPKSCFGPRTSLETQLTNRLRFYAESTGAALLNSTNNGLGSNNATVAAAGSLLLETGAIVTQAPPAGSGDRLDWQREIGLHTQDYRIGIIGGADDWTDDVWNVLKNEKSRFSSRYLINNVSSVLLSGGFIHQTPATGSSMIELSRRSPTIGSWRGNGAGNWPTFSTRTSPPSAPRGQMRFLHATLLREFTILP